jgi:hypothetical protein
MGSTAADEEGARRLTGWKQIGGEVELGEKAAQRRRTQQRFAPNGTPLPRLPVEKDWNGKWTTTVQAVRAWMETCRRLMNGDAPPANDTQKPPANDVAGVT